MHRFKAGSVVKASIERHTLRRVGSGKTVTSSPAGLRAGFILPCIAKKLVYNTPLQPSARGTSNEAFCGLCLLVYHCSYSGNFGVLMRRLIRTPGQRFPPDKKEPRKSRIIGDRPTEPPQYMADVRWGEAVQEVGNENTGCMSNGLHYVVLNDTLLRKFRLSKPSQCQLMLMVQGAGLHVSDSTQEMVHRFTVFNDSRHHQRDGYLWYPDMIDMPTVIGGEIGSRYTAITSVRYERCSFTPWGERVYFQPRHGVIYLGYAYR